MVLAIETIRRETPRGEVIVDLVTLPSGALINIKSPDLSKCKTADDAWELAQVLEAKAIEIECQLELREAGHHRDLEPITAEDPIDPTWPARARMAARMARLHKQDAQRMHARFQARANARQSPSFEREFVRVAKTHLTPGTFEAVEKRAHQDLAAQRTKEKIGEPA